MDQRSVSSVIAGRPVTGAPGGRLRSTNPARLDEVEDFLLRIRSVLHLEAKRNQNVLTHDLQETTARLLGYAGPLVGSSRPAS